MTKENQEAAADILYHINISLKLQINSSSFTSTDFPEEKKEKGTTWSKSSASPFLLPLEGEAYSWDPVAPRLFFGIERELFPFQGRTFVPL